jgi:hypothetical protein
MTSLFRKFKWWLERRRKEDDLREELEFHLSEEADDRQAAGLSVDQARQAALRDLGNVTLVREDARAVWTWTLVEQLAQDVRYALRTMIRNPAFSGLAVLTLALGIGANTAIYSFMDSILIRSLPVPDPDSLAVVKWRSRPVNFGALADPTSSCTRSTAALIGSPAGSRPPSFRIPRSNVCRRSRGRSSPACLPTARPGRST